jgi:methyl-accepting chemotaxis protein
MPETIEMDTMMPARRRLVTESWKTLSPNGAAVGAIFYRRLFEIDPGLRPMFSAVTMDDQIHKLVTMLDLVVHWLDVPDRLVPVLKKLGERHTTYGVHDDHYGKFGTAFIGTLEEGLGDSFTPELRSAWTEAFLLISSLMRRGAAKVSGAFPVVKPDGGAGDIAPRHAAGFDAA